jgi:hypothetical protein
MTPENEIPESQQFDYEKSGGHQEYMKALLSTLGPIRQNKFWWGIPKNAKAGQNRLAKRMFKPVDGPDGLKIFSDGSVYKPTHRGWRKVR